MNEFDYQQGSPEWHELRAKMFTASEAPAMMGASKYKSRSQLLHEKSTGESEEVNSSQQFIFDKGHAAEAAIRPHVEKLIGEELFPTTGVSTEHPQLLASFDGLTMDNSINFEHKLHNKGLIEDMQAGEGELAPHYYWQLEQQMLVSGATKTIFVCSDGTPDNCHVFWYKPVPGRAEQLLAGWEQFARDLEAYTPPDHEPEAVAEPVMALPVLRYSTSTSESGLRLVSNLDEYKAAAEAMVLKATGICETDQDFANAEALGKEFKKAEAKIKTLQGMVLSEVEDIDQFSKDLEYIGEQFRQARLASDKQVKARKEQLRTDMVNKANKAIGDFMNQLVEDRPLPLGVTFPVIDFDFREAIKGKRTIQSVQDAIDDRMAQIQIGVRERHELIMVNGDWIAPWLAEPHDYGYLFNDLNTIIHQMPAPFQCEVLKRIDADTERRKAAAAAQAKADLEAAQAEEIAQQQVNEQKAKIQAEREAAAALVVETAKTPAQQIAEAMNAVQAMPTPRESVKAATEPHRAPRGPETSPALYAWASKWDVNSLALTELIQLITCGDIAA